MARPAPAALSRADAPEAFVSSVAAHFEAAAAHVGAIDHHLRIAGCGVRLRFAGPAVAERLTPAFAHRAGEGAAAPSVDLVVDAFDSRSTATPLPAPPWSWDAFHARGDIEGFTTDTVKVAFDPGTSALSAFDPATSRACWWVPDAARLPDSESSAPLRALLHWWFATVGLQLVHGAVVGRNGRGVLLAGAGGAGKSSTALACLQTGWEFVGDDYCLLDAREEPVAHSVYCTAKVDDAARARLPGLEGLTGTRLANRGKTLFRLWPDFAPQLAADLAIDAVLLPRIGAGSESALAPASPTDVVRAVATSTNRQTPGAGASTWHATAALVRSVPCHVLTLGSDAAAIPDTIASVLR